MTSVPCVCLGNICRSLMAEAVIRERLRRRGRAAEFRIASAKTSGEERRNDGYPPARRMRETKGIVCPRRSDGKAGGGTKAVKYRKCGGEPWA